MDQPEPTDGGERGDAKPESHVPADAGAPTESLVSGTLGDRCVNCGASLSSDQRYCVVCGERRGAPRFTLPPATAATTAAEQGTSASASRPPRGGVRLGIGAIIAGVATLLLAMLVGVLIGHNTANNSAKVASAPVRIIRVDGGSGGTTSSSGSGSGSSSTGSTSAGAKKSKSKSAKASKSKAPVTKKTASKEQNAASKVLGGKGTPPATVTVGQTGTGKGYSKKTHKFNGSFFGQ